MLASAALALLVAVNAGAARADAYPQAMLAPHGSDLLRHAFGSSTINFSGVLVALGEGADPNLAIDGIPVTYLAAQRGRPDIATALLIDGGASPPPCTPAMGACPIQRIVDYVRSHPGEFTDGMTEANMPGAGYAWLVRHGMDANSANESGNTALMTAASYGEFDTARALLKAGADPLRRNNWGASAKMQALHNGHLLIALLIAWYGGDDYVGAVLPPSAYDAELQGKDQRDWTSEMYTQLSALPPGLRFFETYDHQPPLPAPPPVPYIPPPATHLAYFAVLPGSHRVIKLTGQPDALAQLGLSIKTSKQAWQALRVLTDQLGLDYGGVSLTELPALHSAPAQDSCIGVSGSAAIARIRRLGANTIKPVHTADGKAWIVVRTLVVAGSTPRFGSGHETHIRTVYRVHERLDAHGHYRLLAMREVATPELVLSMTCFPL